MLEFRNDMLKLSKKYPDIVKVVITPEAWSEMCASFDKTLSEEQGHTEKNIKDKHGSMAFETLLVEPDNECRKEDS
jgi:hypothetical protein